MVGGEWLKMFPKLSAVSQFQERRERTCVLVETGLARKNSEGREDTEHILVRIEM